MGKLIAIGGGCNGGDFDIQLEEKIRALIPNKHPQVVFIPYASTDFEDNFHEFKQIYESSGCVVNLLMPGKENLLVQADLIYIGRGWTIPLLKKLIDTNVIPILKGVMDKGTIIAGFSAGANC